MAKNVLAVKTGVREILGGHDNSVVVLSDGVPLFAAETGRFIGKKHGDFEFPGEVIEYALKYIDTHSHLSHFEPTLSSIDEVILPYNPEKEPDRLKNMVNLLHDSRYEDLLDEEARTLILENTVDHYSRFRSMVEEIRDRLSRIAGDTPAIETLSHHRCHAASAFYPSGFDESLVLTIDGVGEYESTVLWHGRTDGLDRLRTYRVPNSLGKLYALVTQFLGYRSSNGEGKVMGLAAYGAPNDEIRATFDQLSESGVEYDVAKLTMGGMVEGISFLEDIFDRKAKTTDREFTQWEKDLAYETQSFLEETVTELVRHYCEKLDVGNVAASGGVFLNCKMNKCIRELSCVDELFVQPAAHDASVALGGAMLEFEPSQVSAFDHVYFGPSYSTEDIRRTLEERKLPYEKPNNLEKTVAEELAAGALVGWFQGRLEFGPRALGNRSILADPRSTRTRDRINRYVKGREEWRPFAPSILEEDAGRYLKEYRESPFMTDTFEVEPEYQDEMAAVLHSGDDTTRPQTVRKEQNETYHQLIKQFKEITDVPLVLNTSFNYSGKPIVNQPKDAIRTFYRTGLNLLVLDDFILSK